MREKLAGYALSPPTYPTTFQFSGLLGSLNDRVKKLQRLDANVNAIIASFSQNSKDVSRLERTSHAFRETYSKIPQQN